MKVKHFFFVMQVLHLTEHGFYEMHTNIVWLTSFSGEMIIYDFLLGFSSPSRQKEWFKIWRISDQPNHTNHIKELQSSHCLIMHEDAHLKLYKVKNFVSKAIQGIQVPVYTNTQCFFIFEIFTSFFYQKKKKNLKQRIKNYSNSNHNSHHAWDQESEGITWNLFPSKSKTLMESLSFVWTFVQKDKEESWNHLG